MEFELNSSKYIARALVFDQKYVVEVKLEYLTPVSTSWDSSWNFLKSYDIKNILKISLNQLYADMKYLKPLPNSNSLSPISDDNIARTMEKVLLAHQKIWGKDFYQIIILQDTKEKLLQVIAKSLSQVSGISINKKLSLEFMDKIHRDNTKFIILKNSNGGGFKEDVDSSAFSALPFDNKHNWETDGDRINQQASDSLKSMGMKD